jgi:hypothetical protein
MSYWNGGIPGIYKKASYNTNFSATGNDVYGSWQCNSSLPDRTYPINTTADAIVADLLDANYMFKSRLYKTGMKTNLRTKALSGLLVWSASDPDNQTQLWDVTASYATSFNKTTNQINMHTMNCSMNAPAITWALGLVPANDTLDQWGQKAFGFLRDQETLASSFEEIISQTLNAIVMAAAGGNHIYNGLPPNNTDTQFGCLKDGTRIQVHIFIAFGMLMIVLLVMALSISIFDIMTYFLPAGRKAKVEATPQDLASWQLASMRDVFMDEKIALSDMGNQTFGWLRNGEMVRYRKPGAGDVSLSLFLAALSCHV